MLSFYHFTIMLTDKKVELGFSSFFFLVDCSSPMVLLFLTGEGGDGETAGADSRRRGGLGGGLVPNISVRATR